jgi:hypothetical protein
VCLVLGRGGYVLPNGQVREERVDFPLTHLRGVAHLVEVDEAPDPPTVGLYRARAVVTGAQGLPELVQQLRGAEMTLPATGLDLGEKLCHRPKPRFRTDRQASLPRLEGTRESVFGRGQAGRFFPSR